MGTDIGCFTGVPVAEVGNSLSGSDAGTLWRQLKSTGPGVGIEPGVSRVTRDAADAEGLVAFRDPSVEQVVIGIVVLIPGCGGDAVVPRRAHLEDVVSGDRVFDDPIAADPPRREPIIGSEDGVVKDVHMTGHPGNLDTSALPQTSDCYILQVTVMNAATGDTFSEIVPLQAK